MIDISAKVAADPGYALQVADIETFEQEHGRIPEGSVVFVRSDWSKKWDDVALFNEKPFPGVGLDALKFLHLERRILFHGHEPLDTDATPTLEGEAWLLHNHFTQAEGVANLDLVPPTGALVTIGFAKPLAAHRRFCSERGLLLFEDCALALFSAGGGVPLGSVGDAAAFCLY